MRKNQASNIWRFLFVLSFFLLIVLRLPSLFEPKWYGDEGQYAAVAHHINSGYILYKNIWDNKPPIIYLLYLFFNCFGTHIQLVARFTSLAFSAFSSLVLFFLVRDLTKKPPLAYASAVLLNILLALLLFEANIANAENFFILFVLLGLYFVLKNQGRFWFLGGCFFSLSVLTKIPPIIEVSGILLFLLIEQFIEKVPLKKVGEKLLLISLGFLAPFLLISSYFILNQAFSDFIFSAFTFGLFYIKDVPALWIIPRFLKSTLLLRSALLLMAAALFARLRVKDKISKVCFLSLMWFSASVFAAMLSARPYPHYVLEVLPSFALLTAIFIHSPGRVKKLAVFFGISWLLLNIFTEWKPYTSYNPKNYYGLFLNKIRGKISQEEFEDAFDWKVRRARQIRKVLDENYPEIKSVFIYDEFPWLYDIAEIYSPVRFTVSYHFFWQDWHRQKTVEDLERSPPKLIIVKSDADLDEWFKNYLTKDYKPDREYWDYSFYRPGLSF